MTERTAGYVFRKILSFIMVIIVLSTAVFASSGQSNSPRVVRVGYYINDGFQDYDEGKDVYSGYSYEFLMALQQYTNWKYEFVPCQFAEGLEMLKNGELDLMNNVTKTDDREEIYEFTHLSTGENIAYLAMKPGDTRVALDDLEGIAKIKIGLAKDSLYSTRLISYLESYNLTPNIEWYDTRDDVTSAFENDEVDAYIITSSKKTNEHIILSFSPEAYYIASAKGNDELIRELDKSISALRINDPSFEYKLKEKYYGRTTENYTVLTSEEKEYIAENPVTRVLYQQNWYPLCYSDKNGEFAGAIRGVYDLISERTGMKFEFVPVDENNDSDNIVEGYNALVMAEQPTDFSGAEKYNIKLTKSFVSPPLMEVANHILSPGDSIALVEGDYLSDVCHEIYGDSFKYIECSSIDECLEKVHNKLADGTVLISYESEFYRQMGKYSALTYTIVDEGHYSLSIGVSNEADQRLYSILQKGLNSIDAGEMTNIMNNTLMSLHKEDFLSLLNRNPLPVLIVAAIIISLIVGLVIVLLFMRKLRSQNIIINEKNEALSRASRATTNFFSRMSHDMRTPMNGILGMAKLSEDEQDENVLKQNIAKIQNSGEYLLSLINDTLDFQRIESGKLTLSPEIICGGDISQGIYDIVKPSADKKHIELRVLNEGAELNRYVLCDPVRIKQIFLNLLSNAIKFTPEGGTISVSFRCLYRGENKTHVIYTITDTGIGMSEDFIRTKMFKPFSQEQNEVTGQYAGSGLGLSIVKSLVQLMDGSITVESELGVGTTFTLKLDFTLVSDEEAKKEKDSAGIKKNYATQKLAGRKILLAEDHPLNAEIAVKLLDKVGCTVTSVKNGEECINVFSKSDEGFFDAVLMDIRMPVMNGLDAAKEIRAMNRSDAKTVPIIAMTANAYEDDIKKSLDAGMNAHLAKPIDPSALYKALSDAIMKNRD